MARIFLLHKPCNVLCQFSDEQGRRTLADFMPVPGVYPAGRLDRDSEGLVLLTDQGALQHRITSPQQKMEKTYQVQVEGTVDDATIAALARGVTLQDGLTAPARVRRICAPDLPPRVPPVRYRPSIPTCWLELILTEGRNRQVRRMTAAVGHPTLRLVRTRIGPWQLASLGPGEWCQQQVHLPASTPRTELAKAKRKHYQQRGKRP